MGTFDKASAPRYSAEVYEVAEHRGLRHVLKDGAGNTLDMTYVASDLRTVPRTTALYVPKPRARKKTYDAASINVPFTEELRRRPKRRPRADYSSFF